MRKTLVCYGGLGFDGLPREGTSPIRCECYRTYAGPTHGELAGACRPTPGPAMVTLRHDGAGLPVEFDLAAAVDAGRRA